jgi:hypothetical protein
MLATIIVISLIVVAFWRGLLRFVLAALLVLVVIGGIQAMQALGALVTVPPQQTQCPPADHNC